MTNNSTSTPAVNEAQVREALRITLDEWRNRLEPDSAGDTDTLIETIIIDVVDYLFRPELLDDDLALRRSEIEKR